MELGRFFHEGESESGAFGAGVFGAMGVEAVEGFFQSIVGEAGAVVAHGEGDLFAEGGEVNFDGGVFGAEIEGVLKEVFERGAENVVVAFEDHFLGRGDHFEVDVFEGGLGGEELGGFVQEGFEVDGLALLKLGFSLEG